jgi:uncharacterized protein (TIGR04376 family)
MGLFDDFSQFLDSVLNNPYLDLQELIEKLQKQEQDTGKLIIDLEREKQNRESEILDLAKEIQHWHGRIDKAKAAGRLDLAKAAQEREGELLRQGNQLWERMETAKKRIRQAQELLEQIGQKRRAMEVKAAEFAKTQAASNRETTEWNQSTTYSSYNKSADPLEAEFQRWEMEEELQRMKRDLGRFSR